MSNIGFKAKLASTIALSSAAIYLLLTTDLSNYSLANTQLTNLISETGQTNFLSSKSSKEKHIQREFVEFAARYGKTYASRDHHQSKYETFKENYLKIQEHNQKPNKSYELGVNKFSDMTEEEFMKTFGTLQEHGEEYEKLKFSLKSEKSDNKKFRLTDRPHHYNTTNQDEQEQQKKKQEANAKKERYQCSHDEEDHYYFDYNDYDFIDDLPKCKSIDWIKKGKVGIPKDQSTCGSCWAHSTLASVETLYAIENNIQNRSEVPSFSEQQLVDCNFIPNLGCIGGRRQFSFNYTLQEGATLASNYPYQNKQNYCTYKKETDNFYQISAFKAFEKINNADLEKLVCQGTVSISIRINDCIKNYKSGVLYDGDGSCGCSKIKSTNHAVAIVGFGRDEENPVCQDYWVIKNSWGPGWGEEGFMRLCREDSQIDNGTCNIRQEPMIALQTNPNQNQ
eukprot:403336383